MLHQRVLIKGLAHFLFILILPKLNLGSWEDHTFNTEEILKCKQEWLKLLSLVVELFSSCPLASPFILIEILQTARCHVNDETIEWIENKNDQVWVLLHFGRSMIISILLYKINLYNICTSTNTENYRIFQEYIKYVFSLFI